MNVNLINTASPFRDLFPINEKLLDAIVWDMRKNGYDRSQPIIAWEGHDSIVIDGHTRLRAARKAGLDEIPVMLKRFEDEAAALEYAIKCQKNRRNLKDYEIMNCIKELDKRMPSGQRTDLAQDCARFGKSAQSTAKSLGISSRKVEQVRTVMDRAPDDVKAAVQSGNMSINAAYNKTVKKDESKLKYGPLSQEEQIAIGKMMTIAKESLSGELYDEFEKFLTQLLTTRENQSR